MDEKISLEAIALYGDAYADKVLKNFFATKDKISGQEILALCNVQQVNLFVVRELFKTWKEEIRKFKSPYFDFEDAEVKEALDTFMNIVSKHILIGQAHFGPLLKKAVSQTLMVIFDPYDFYSLTISGKNNKLEVGPFREEIKYLKINKAPLEKMLQKLEQMGVQEITGNEAFSILDHILEEVSFTPEDLEGFIDKFSEVVPLDPLRFIVSKEEAPQPPSQPRTNTVRQEPPREAPRQQEPPRQEPPRTNQPRTNQPRAVGDVNKGTPTVNDKMNAQRTMVVDSFRKIDRIKDSLTINQKFMFTKMLFKGDFEIFSQAIEKLDRLDNLNQALKYFEDNYPEWDRESEEYEEFMELVEKRFA